MGKIKAITVISSHKGKRWTLAISAYGIRDEWKESWKDCDEIWAKDMEYNRHMADLSVHLLAGWKRERFERKVETGPVDRLDPRFDFTDADWLRVAREELGK